MKTHVWYLASGPACQNGSGKLPWCVCRVRRHDDLGGSLEYLWTPGGRLRRFATPEAAQKVADELNTIKWSSFNMCGVQTVAPDGETVTVDGYQSGDEGGFALTYRFQRYEFSSRRDAYAATALLFDGLAQ